MELPIEPSMADLYEQLAHAIWHGDIGVVRDLLARGIDVNVRADIDGSLSTDAMATTPLILSVQISDIDIARLLIKAGADVEVVGGGMTPLQHAIDVVVQAEALRGEWEELECEMVRLLVAAGANLDAAGTIDESAREMASRNGLLWLLSG